MLRAGAARPHVLIAAMPGGTAVRLAAEQELRRRGWPAAMTPADADVLLVAGDPAASFAGVLDAAWEAMPAPRARAQAARPGEVAAVLETARGRLGDRSGQQALAARASRHAARHGDAAAGASRAGRPGPGPSRPPDGRRGRGRDGRRSSSRP